MHRPLLLLLLALVAELQVADADCEIKYCVDNKDCDIDFIDCAEHNGTIGTQKNGTQVDKKIKELNCSGINEFKGTKSQSYKINEDVNFITLTEIEIPKGVKVTIGQLDCKRNVDNCNALRLGHEAVPPIPHFYFQPGKQRFKITASAPTAIIKFTCQRQCFNLGGNANGMMKRIVNGYEAGANHYPFMARLLLLYSVDEKDYSDCNDEDSTNITEIAIVCKTTIIPAHCGGSIIQKSYILTAQHCVVDTDIDVEGILEDSDTIKNGKLSYTELYGLLHDSGMVLETLLLKWLNMSDANGDSELDLHEFNNFLKNLKTINPGLHKWIRDKFNTTYLVGVIVTVGDHDRTLAGFLETEEREIWVPTTGVIRSPGYNRITIDNDIALLKLSSPIELVETHRYPICLPPYYWNEKDVLENCLVLAAGWGETENMDLSNVLMVAPFKIISHADCKMKYSFLTENMICIRDDRTSTCDGDSGGPVFCQASDDYFYEVGVISFGSQNETTEKWIPGYPMGTAKVTRYLKWIAKEVKHLP